MPTDYFPVGPVILTLIVRELGEEECSIVTLHFPVGSVTLIQTLLVRQYAPAAEGNSFDEDVNRVQAQYEASKV